MLHFHLRFIDGQYTETVSLIPLKKSRGNIIGNDPGTLNYPFGVPFFTISLYGKDFEVFNLFHLSAFACSLKKSAVFCCNFLTLFSL